VTCSSAENTFHFKRFGLWLKHRLYYVPAILFRKGTMPPPKAICSQCGKAIVGRAKVSQFRGRAVCSPCAKELEKATRPATSAQIDFLRSLSFPNPEQFTFNQARWTLDHAQEVRYYCFQVARQEWHKDLKGYDLRVIIHATFSDPQMLEDIYQTMDRRQKAAYERQHAEQEAHWQDADYDGVAFVDCVPDLPKDLNYRKIRDGLLALLGPDAFRPASSFWDTIIGFFTGK
jgi:hypothetical protein